MPTGQCSLAMKLIEAKAIAEYKAPQHGALIMLVPAIRVIEGVRKRLNLFEPLILLTSINVESHIFAASSNWSSGRFGCLPLQWLHWHSWLFQLLLAKRKALEQRFRL